MNCPSCEKELICNAIKDQEDLIIVGSYSCLNMDCQVIDVIIKSPA